MKITNKTTLLIALFIAAITLNSCDKKKTIKFEKTFDGIRVELPPTNSTGKQNIQALVTGIQKFAEEKKFNMDDITKVKPTKLTIAIKDTSTLFDRHTYDQLDYVGIFVYAINLNKMELGVIVPPHDGSTSIEIPLNDVDIKEYVKTDSFYFYAEISNNDTITHIVPLEATMSTDIETEVTTNLLKR